MTDGRKLEIYGSVQGVGFKKHVKERALSNNLLGNVFYHEKHVVINIVGDLHDMDSFIEEFDRELPDDVSIKKTSIKVLSEKDQFESFGVE